MSGRILVFPWLHFLWEHFWLKLMRVAFKSNSSIIQITPQMTEQAVLGKFSDYYTNQVILGRSLSLPRSLHLFGKQLLQYVIAMRTAA